MASVGHLNQAPSAPRSIPVWSWLATKNRGYYIAGYAILIFLGFWTAFPVYWQLATSLRSDADLYTPVVNLIPRAWTLNHYYNVLFGARSQFGIQFVNSLIVAFWTTFIAVFFGAMAGYSLTRLRFVGRANLARVLVYSYLAPGTILFIPLYVMMNNFGLRDSLGGLVLAHLTFSVPFSTWILMGYFKTIPVELEEAALVDGASRLTALWRIVLPLAAPAVVVVSVFAFTGSWRELLYALVLTQAKEKMTAPIGLTAYVVGDTFYWGQMMAAATLLSLPPLLLYLFGQRWVIQGWTAGAVKS
ncbi:MAG TPA: carbohydrate ABC transporter permease [Chloroflexota bacterium]|nr:carbohydrate ABC transporter permease [Chloroflexota bacterium]